jgi:LmbE family N-acetylglucosaminyl deacetylase
MKKVGELARQLLQPVYRLLKGSKTLFSQPNSDIFIPDGTPTKTALNRTTHLAIGAHQDDLEIMAVDGILHCFRTEGDYFTGIVMTDGQSSPRSGIYENLSDQEMMETRYTEQKKAAFIGNYSAQIMLGFTSKQLKNPANVDPNDDIMKIIKATRPKIIYTHNLADKHATHVAVALRVIQSIRMMDETFYPDRVFGCEVWRDLDWMSDTDKVGFDTSDHINLQESLLGVFDSQISGGKRYDLATMGRRLANATYFESHSIDQATHLAYAMDLTPLIQEKTLDIEKFVCDQIDKFKQEVRNLIKVNLAHD